MVNFMPSIRYDSIVCRDATGEECGNDLMLVRLSSDHQGHHLDTPTKVLDGPHSWLERGAQMLQQQWPRGGPISIYRQKLLSPALKRVQSEDIATQEADDRELLQIDNYSCSQTTHKLYPSYQGHYTLPCSYLLIQDQTKCVAHGRLTDCFEGAGGNAAAVTYLVVDSAHRKGGFGRLLMNMLEMEAVRLGYHYIYLWTKTAIGFYDKLGYQHTHRVSLYRPCLKSLQVAQISSLESAESSKSDSIKETITLPPDDENSIGDKKSESPAEDAWLKKRLIETAGAKTISHHERKQDIDKHIRSCISKEKQYEGIPHKGDADQAATRIWFNHVPWQAQIGPSCGLAALRMVRDYFHQAKEDETCPTSPPPMPSLLEAAQDRGFSSDGEIFNIDNLQTLAEEVCGIDCSVAHMTKPGVDSGVDEGDKAEVLLDIFNTLQRGGLAILPYDSNPRTRSPCKLRGYGAHYGIIVGIMILDHSGVASIATTSVFSSKTRVATTGNDSVMFSNLDVNSLTESLKVDASEKIGEHIEQRANRFSSSNEQNAVHVMVQHSLSQNLSIAPWDEFCQSNLQLDEADETKYSSIDRLNLKNRVLLCRNAIT